MTLEPTTRRETLLVALVVLAVASLLAVLLQGLAGDEEVAHYLIARYAPGQPELFLSLVGRPLVTLWLALPAQAGLIAARLAMALATALGAMAVYRGARHLPGLAPGWAVAFFLVQPFLLAHAGTAMTEPLTAALVAWALAALAERRQLQFALAVGLLPLARFEMLVFLPVAVGLLARARAWTGLGMLGVPLLAWHVAGWTLTGDPLYLLHLSDPAPYPRRDALHYLQSLVWVVGLGLFVPFLAGLARSFSRGADRGPGERLLLGSSLVVAVLLLVYTATAAWKPITLGNLRYLAFVAAPVAWLAAAGVHALVTRSPRWKFFVLFAALAGAILLWGHPMRGDYEFLSRRTWWPVVAVLAWSALAFAPRRPEIAGGILVVVLSAFTLVQGRLDTLHARPQPEEAAVLELAAAMDPEFEKTLKLYGAHPLMAYALGMNPYAQKRFITPGAAFSSTAPEGTIWFWDTHYSHRPGVGAQVDSLLANGWRVATGWIAADSTWAGAFLVRGGPPEEVIRRAFAPGLPPAQWFPLARYAELAAASVRNAIRKDPASPRWPELLHVAQRLGDAGHPELALSCFTGLPRALDADAHYLCASQYAALRNTDAMGVHANAALELAGDDVDLALAAAELLARAGRVEDAARVVDRYAGNLPETWDASMLAGELLRVAGRSTEAVPYFRDAIRLNPQEPTPRLRVAELAVASGNLPEAEAELRAAVVAAPDAPAPYESLGALLLGMERRAEALAVWREGLARTGAASLAERLRAAGAAP